MGEMRDDLLGGGFPAWTLPCDASVSGYARRAGRHIGESLGLPDEQTYDLTVALSELAANAHLHAKAKVIELWAYLRWTTRPELVFKVFDSAAWQGPPPQAGRPAPTAIGGRGFEVVDALTREHGGTWGVHVSRSRLSTPRTSGKAVHVSTPLPAGLRPSPRLQGPTAAYLHDLLDARHLGSLQASYGHGMAVLCVKPGLHTWIHPNEIITTTPGDTEPARFALHDAVEAAERLISRFRTPA